MRSSRVLALAALAIAGCAPDEPADVVVSEVMASNRATLFDADGDTPDWIELHNRGASAASLAGWALTDDERDRAKWTFPDTTLGVGERLVVFASGKDRRDPDGELHANFKLARDGEFLALVNPAGELVGFPGRPYPPQSTDLSFDYARGTFARPSPGASSTSEGWSGVSEPPRPEVASATFADTFTVVLVPPSDSTAVRFTTDGSMPDEEATLYEGPFEVTGVTHLRARSFEPGLAPSEVARAAYVRVDAPVRAFQSELPVLLAATPELELGRELAPLHLRRLNGAEAYDGGIRRRGSTTWLNPKRSYAIEIRDARGRDRAVPLLGLPAEADWVLWGPYEFDRALMRNVIAFELARRMGRYAPRTRYCELFVHAGAGAVTTADYRGLYVLMEKVERGRERVDVSARGSLVKLDRPDPGDEGFEAAGLRIQHVYPKEAEITAAHRARLVRRFEDFGRSLADRTFADHVDVDAWIDYHLLNELAKNPDGTWQSFFLSLEEGGPIRAGPVWDFDRAMAPDVDTRARDPHGWSGARLLHWFGPLFEDPGFRARYAERWRELRAGPLATASMRALIDGLADEIRGAQARNFTRWPEVGPGADGWQVGQVERLKDWLAARAAWIDAELEAAE